MTPELETITARLREMEEQAHLLLHETKTSDAVPRDRVEGLAQLASEARKLIESVDG
jgi:hypothetical protein